MSSSINSITIIILSLFITQVLSAPTNSTQVSTTTIEPPLSTTNSSISADETTESPNVTSYQNTSTFTCQGRLTGYYADVRLGCRVYHFCTQLESISGTSYQRMSYVCMDGSYFDQRDLNCVKESDMKVPCEKAEAEFESSNKQFDPKDESQPSLSDSLTANILMNPITRFIAGR